MVKITEGGADIHPPSDLIFQILPEQGAIEVQNDAPGKLHDWHKHDTDETLIIIKGEVRFFWEAAKSIADPAILFIYRQETATVPKLSRAERYI